MATSTTGLGAIGGRGYLGWLIGLVFMGFASAWLVEKRRRLVCWCAVVVVVMALLACGRAGFDLAPEGGIVSVEANDDVEMSAGPGERLWIRGAPVLSAPFTVRRY